MDPISQTASLAKALNEYGPWAMVALLIFALRWAVLRYDGAQEARIKEGKELSPLLASNTEALRKTHVLIESQSASIAALTVRLQNFNNGNGSSS